MKCRLCGHQCNLNRDLGQGLCRLDNGIYISFYGLHFGEEPYLVGQRDFRQAGHGSGTIFFLGCNLRCGFCQNFQISRWTYGCSFRQNEKKISVSGLVDIFFELKNLGALNINLVSPTPYVFQIAQALKKAKKNNLNLPIVYNTHGYDSQAALRRMQGLVDIYLPDAKYAFDDLAQKYSAIPDYVQTNQLAIREMFRQVGPLHLEKGIAQRGLAVRHLVLPGNIENSMRVLDFLAKLDNGIALSLMAQYHPRQELLSEIPEELRRTLTREEYQLVIEHALDLGLDNCLIQELESHGNYLPNFNLEKSFS